jgi:phosphothreonine lyase
MFRFILQLSNMLGNIKGVSLRSDPRIKAETSDAATAHTEADANALQLCPSCQESTQGTNSGKRCALIHGVNLKLDLSFVRMQLNTTTETPRIRLENQFEQLRAEIDELLPNRFRIAGAAPGYKKIQAVWDEIYDGFVVNKIPYPVGDAFIHARRKHVKFDGEFDGDKFHVSVAGNQIEAGFAAIASLLFSNDSPINRWKVTDMASVSDTAQGRRISQGAQFTLYVTTGSDGYYSALGLRRIKDFTNAIEDALAAREIAKGVMPQSDVASDHWHYVSYRNENRSDRMGGNVQEQSLRNEPFFRLVS